MNILANSIFKQCLILLFSSMLISCSPINRDIMSKNRFYNGFRTIYSNDSLKVRIDFYGNTNFEIKRVPIKIRKQLRKRNISTSNNQILIGEYKYLNSASLLLGSIQARFDSSGYVKRISRFNSEYFYLIKNCKKYSYAKIYIPISKNNFLMIDDIVFDKSKNSSDYKEQENSIHFVYDQLRTEDSYDTTTLIDLQDFTEQKFKANGVGNYLLPVEELQNSEYYSDFDLYEDFLKTYKSFLGESENYSTTDQNKEISWRNRTSIDSIITMISNERVVMFNENHLFPSNRLLLNLCLKKLYLKGFSILALEALGNDEEDTNKRGFVNIESGFYTRDPQMANLIRNALKIGYKVINYEDFGDSKNRDFHQAKNILKKTNKLKGNLKLLVLAGGDHIKENNSSTEEDGSMASYFKTLSGINPYTINQVYYLESRVDSLLEISCPPVGGTNDLYIINGLKSDSIFLESHLLYEKTLIKYKDFYQSIPESKTGLYLYYSNEYLKDKSTIPVYVTYFDKDIILNLPTGIYTYLIKTVDGTIIDDGEINIIR